MSDKLVDMRNVHFLLNEMLEIEKLTEHPDYQEHSAETFDMVLDTAYELAQEVLWPSYQSDDQEGAKFDGTKTTAPKGVHKIYEMAKEGGWFAPAAPEEWGGMGMPYTIMSTLSFIFNAANTSAYMYIGSAAGAALLINNHGTDDLKKLYLPKLFAGEWGGTMCLSEPDVGSALGDLTTTARKAEDGDHYYLKGVKRWISSGDHDLTENIVHPVLARIEGAPPGTKGISLFLVPKYRPNADGSVGEFNDVQTAGIEHKLGLRAQATATLNLGEKDDCHGWLLGEPNRGLIHMFDLVNNARIHTGMQAVAQASTAYHIALQYSRERLQGRPFSNPDPATPPVPIIRHADVRNMLLQQKAYVEGIFGLLAFCANLNDRARIAGSEEEANKLIGMLGVLTPVCKAYGSDSAFESIRLAIQCLGGAGFTEDFPVAQMLRDNKVFSIYEGTNAIQGQDLLGRRVVKNQGEDLRTLMAEMSQDIAEGKQLDEIKDLAGEVEALMNAVGGLTMHLGQIGMAGDVELYMANATLYLRIFSEMVIAWQWLKQATVSQKALASSPEDDHFYNGKIATARFYIDTTLPHTKANIEILSKDPRHALDFPEHYYDGQSTEAEATAGA